MDKLYIKAPDGRIIPAPRALTVSKTVGGAAVVSVDPAKLKAGWTVADAASIAKLQADQADAAKAEAQRLADEQAASLPAQVAALHVKIDALAAPKKKAD